MIVFPRNRYTSALGAGQRVLSYTYYTPWNGRGGKFKNNGRPNDRSSARCFSVQRLVFKVSAPKSTFYSKGTCVLKCHQTIVFLVKVCRTSPAIGNKRGGVISRMEDEDLPQRHSGCMMMNMHDHDLQLGSSI